jgi:hypothetical protein
MDYMKQFLKSHSTATAPAEHPRPHRVQQQVSAKFSDSWGDYPTKPTKPGSEEGSVGFVGPWVEESEKSQPPRSGFQGDTDNANLGGYPASQVNDAPVGGCPSKDDVSLAYKLRRRKCCWPDEWQVRWSIVANKLELEHGLMFPISEIEAFNQVLNEMETA